MRPFKRSQNCFPLVVMICLVSDEQTDTEDNFTGKKAKGKVLPQKVTRSYYCIYHKSKETYCQTRGLSNLEMKYVGELAITGAFLKAVKTSWACTTQGHTYLTKHRLFSLAFVAQILQNS